MISKRFSNTLLRPMRRKAPERGGGETTKE